jgi:hypothetical protein
MRREAPRSPCAACFPPICPSSPQLSPKQAVSPPTAHFNWAEDAESLPIPQPAAHTHEISQVFGPANLPCFERFRDGRGDNELRRIFFHHLNNFLIQPSLLSFNLESSLPDNILLV